MRCGFPIHAIVAAAAIGGGAVALAQPANDYGIDFVTVGAVNNPAFIGGGFPNPVWPAPGRGSVSYEYRIGRTEITTAQWMQFVNTFNGTTSQNAPAFFNWAGPFWWGAVNDPTYSGPGFRYVLPANDPDAGMQPVFGISWREAALYCNWLHNGQSTNPVSLLTGAYDVSTWGTIPGGTITDGLTHLPGALFWIPTYDEQMKAFHYDPNRHGPGQGGYWADMNGRDTRGIAGPPGVGQTSAGWEDPNTGLGEFNIPLGAYPSQMSPWGLLDTSGGTTEWSELITNRVGPPTERGSMGAPAGSQTLLDNIYQNGSQHPDSGGSDYGFRIASSVPSPGAASLVVAFAFSRSVRRKRSSR